MKTTIHGDDIDSARGEPNGAQEKIFDDDDRHGE
jgi:hypothetical protein